MPYLVKIVISALLVVAVAEATKRWGFWGSLLASLPVVSVLAMIWIYWDTKDIAKISLFSIQVFWFVIPSLGLFLTLPWFLTRYSFFLSLALACAVTVILFLAMLGLFKIFHYHPLG